MAQIHQEQPAQSVRALCALFGASRGWSYARPAADDDRVARDVALRDAIEALLLEFPGYGYRRVTHALPRAGWTVTQKRVPRVPRVPRVRREESLLCQLKRRFVVPSPRDARHPFTTYPNLLADAVLDAPTQAWGADITALRLPTTFVSPAAHDLWPACWTPARGAVSARTSRARSIPVSRGRRWRWRCGSANRHRG